MRRENLRRANELNDLLEHAEFMLARIEDKTAVHVKIQKDRWSAGTLELTEEAYNYITADIKRKLLVDKAQIEKELEELQ